MVIMYATGANNFLSVVSRVGVNFKGPNVWGTKATGKLKSDFFGNTLKEKHRSFQIKTCLCTVGLEGKIFPYFRIDLVSFFFVPEVFRGYLFQHGNYV